MEQRRYGLFTAITMIVGIVIGSGIFFRSDDILRYTGGSIAHGILVFCIAAFAIIFGCLTIDVMAGETDKPGGAITYFNEFIGKKIATAFGWFQCFFYYPALTVLISWVAGIYISLLFGFNSTFNLQMLIGFIWFFVCYIFNILSGKAGGAFQNASTIIKIIPLLVIGSLGLIFGDPVDAVVGTGAVLAADTTTFGWLAAIGPIAFSFDGWIISTSVAFEVKDSKKNMPRALVIAPLFILALYLLYFVGMSSLVGPQRVIELGDESVYYAAQILFGGPAARVVLGLVSISVMGTVNGIVLGFIRIPYSLAKIGVLPAKEWLSVFNKKFNMPIRSGLFAFVICMVWWGIHYLYSTTSFLGNIVPADFVIAIGYVFYSFLYIRVIIMWKRQRVKSLRRGLIFPILAILGAAFVVLGGVQNFF